MLSSGLRHEDPPQGAIVQHFTASDGLQLAYAIDDFTDPWTSASTLLLLHAAMGHSGRYYAWVPRLSRHYRVVRMDLRGHGASGVPPADPPLTMQRLVKDTAELLDHLGCKSAHIVGNSAGGYVGQNLAMNSPERVRSLMLFGSTPGLRHSSLSRACARLASRCRCHLKEPADGDTKQERNQVDNRRCHQRRSP
jgi:pimeloyl-ACP methyl ester carboxylesterase